MSDEKATTEEDVTDLAYALAGWSVGDRVRSCDQTPRDVLVRTLAAIDSGALKPDALLILVREPTDNPKENITHLKSSCSDVSVAMVMIADAGRNLQTLIAMHLGTRK